MTFSPGHLEGIARKAHDSTGGLLPIDASRLAELCARDLANRTNGPDAGAPYDFKRIRRLATAAGRRSQKDERRRGQQRRGTYGSR